MTDDQKKKLQAIADTFKDEAMHIERLIAANHILLDDYIETGTAAEALLTGYDRRLAYD